jgi:porphobilinogen synthase
MPVFVTAGQNKVEPIASMPGIFRFSVDRLSPEIEEIVSLGIPAIILFGIPEKKNSQATGAWMENGVVQRAISEIKLRAPKLLVIGDVCACEYTDHGHCGIVVGDKVDNDLSVELHSKTALSLARAGADIIAPSDMMDGRVKAIRAVLDESGFSALPILSYAVKYASSFYGPFREAAGGAPQFGDRKTYQMDPANIREALREVKLDIDEGADMVMVKPAMPYLDVLSSIKKASNVPVFAFQVSGEYAMIKAAAQNGWLNEPAVILESLTSIVRAGADGVITYFAKAAAKVIYQKN